MTIKCRECGGEIDFKESTKTGKKYPVNVNGEFHNCRNKTTTPAKVVTQQGVGWTNIKAVKEISLEEVPGHILAGWIILDRVERMEFVSKDFAGIAGQTMGRTETGNVTRSVYIVGQR